MKVAAIIPAAGQGKRMGQGINKQYLLLAGKPVLAHTLLQVAAAPAITDIYVVVAPGEENYCKSHVIDAYAIPKIRAVIPGGQERQDSVHNALQCLDPDTALVVVHDGARPFINAAFLEELIQLARATGAVVPVLPVKDTIKQVQADGMVVQTLPRGQLRAVQTPQVFRYPWLLDAYRQAMAAGYHGTDDASLVERAGYPVKSVPGLEENIKLTTPFDLMLGQQILMMQVRG